MNTEMKPMNATPAEMAAQEQLLRDGTVPPEYVQQKLTGSFSNTDKPFAAVFEFKHASADAMERKQSKQAGLAEAS